MNFELLRIVAMLLIITSHCIIHTKIPETIEKFTTNWYILEFIRIPTRFSVNIFIMITGYYMVKSKFKTNKLISLWGLTFFYSFFVLLGLQLINGKIILKYFWNNIFVFSSGKIWFFTIYIGLYVLSPFINKVINSINKKQYKILLLFMLYLLVIHKMIYPEAVSFESNNGYNITWFIFLYILGGYIRLHYDKKINKNIYLLLSVIITIIVWIIRILYQKQYGKECDFIFNFNNILILLLSATVFLYFKELKINNKLLSKIISKIAPLMFAIYLIHDNGNTMGYWIRFVMRDYSFVNTKIFIPRLFGTVLLVFVTCSIIEAIRRILFTLVRSTKIYKKIKQAKVFVKIEGLTKKLDEILGK